MSESIQSVVDGAETRGTKHIGSTSRWRQVIGLAEARRRLGVTQAHLAKVAGVASRSVKRLERGRRAQLETYRAVMGALRILEERKLAGKCAA